MVQSYYDIVAYYNIVVIVCKLKPQYVHCALNGIVNIKKAYDAKA